MGVECNVTPLGCCSNSILHLFSAIITPYIDFDFYGVLQQHSNFNSVLIKHTKLELDFINSFVTDSTFRNSLLHHLYCITSVPPLHIVYLTRRSKSTWLGYIWNTSRGSSMIPQMIRQLLCTGIKCSLGTITYIHLPITTDLLHSLKLQLRNDASYS